MRTVSGGFDRGGWTAAYGDEEGLANPPSPWFDRADAFLLGRKTWEIWEPYWPLHDSGDPVSHGINVLPKYVPSTTLKEPTWQNTHVIDGDVEAAVRELKQKPGRQLQVHGSGELLRWLLERDLVDELNLRIYPVVVGDGLRLFPERGQTHNLELVETPVDEVRRDDPDLSACRKGDVRQRRGSSAALDLRFVRNWLLTLAMKAIQCSQSPPIRRKENQMTATAMALPATTQPSTPPPCLA